MNKQMTEKIKALAEAAEWYTDGDPLKKNPILDRQKFAELIVGECIGCCEQVISDPVPESVDTWLNGGSQCIAEIKQHFGVEE